MALSLGQIIFGQNYEEIQKLQTEYKKILEIDPKNSTARYHIYMAEGEADHKKGHKNGQWDAIQSFAKAATTIDTVGEPYYWAVRAYEKKD